MKKTPVKSERNIALDIFRGLTICFMIIVNTSGNGDTTYWPLKHADWNGFTPTDLVFPSFLFAVGTSLAFVLQRWKTIGQSEVVMKITKRTFTIFIIGFLMYWFPFFRLDNQLHIIAAPLSDTRIMGVLQRIALCYGISALLVYFLGLRKTLGIALFILPFYWALLWFFGADGAQYTKTGNAVLKLDVWALGANHLYTGEGFPFDPEGILSTIPALFNVIAGYAAGTFLQQKDRQSKVLLYLTTIGLGMILTATLWNEILPVNKKLWTSSFALLTVGLDFLLISLIVYVVDILHFQKGAKFFLVAGKNPLLIYLMSELGVTVLWMIRVNGEPLFHWLYTHIFVYAGNYFGAFLFAIWWMLTCWLLGYILDRKKIYIKI
jgi:predicted acyltransferase